MKKLTLIVSILISGCAGMQQNHQPQFTFSDESLKKPTYSKDYVACDRIAKNNKQSVSGNAVGSAAAGAGVAALAGLILGADIGAAAGLGALFSGVSGAAGTHGYNVQNYRHTFSQCMRDRGYQVY